MAVAEYPWADLIESEPWRVGDAARWDSLERLNEMYSVAGKWPAHGPDASDLTHHRDRRQAQECWLCGKLNVYYLAQGRVEVDYDKREFECVRCRVELEYVIPLVAVPRPWFWGRPDAITPTAIRDALRQWEASLV